MGGASKGKYSSFCSFSQQTGALIIFQCTRVFCAGAAVRSPPSRWDHATACNHHSRGAGSRRQQVGVHRRATRPLCVSVLQSDPHEGICHFRFQVDFIKGSDVVFHFNPRFNEQTIVRNSNLGHCWGPEERDGGFPFVQGRTFEVSNRLLNSYCLRTVLLSCTGLLMLGVRSQK